MGEVAGCSLFLYRMVVFSLTLIRHGETGANKENVIQGQLDVPLSEGGLQQACLLADRLLNQHYTHVFSSDLARAHQTAQSVLDKSLYSKGPIRQDPRLRERRFGVVEGKTFSELKKLAKHANQSVPNFTPQGAETVQEVRDRATTFFQDLCKQLSEEGMTFQKEAKRIRLQPMEKLMREGKVLIKNGAENEEESSGNGKENGVVDISISDTKDSTNFSDSSTECEKYKSKTEVQSADCNHSTNEDGILNDNTVTSVLKDKVVEAKTDTDVPVTVRGKKEEQKPLCVYVPTGQTPKSRKKAHAMNAANLGFPSGRGNPPVLDDSSPGGEIRSHLFHGSTTVRNGDCPNVSLTPVNAKARNAERKTSVDSAEDYDLQPPVVANVLAVSHGGLLRELIRYFVEELGCCIPGGKGQALRISPNTGISKFTVSVTTEEQPRVICLLIHDKDHLKGITTFDGPAL